ncbi:hypothetical protein [Paenibacillus sp. N3.4]|uniref:hypothetical protein n=1 Tax=Paenibacillus sp. N3.4 TaxID=2603222 RepID=UPI0011C825B8|nr:hypothetical protein [Paenibacillus sp. N3.4]TXK71261.1 hypothetical protein FU659_33175 [Paenibacillus sp. N3.4]
MKKKELIIGISCIVLLFMLAVYMLTSYKWMQGILSDSNESIDGSFVVMLLDASNKPTKYWVLEDENVDLSNGLISFSETDGQTIHLHGNVIMKEYDDANQLLAIKKEYGLK